MSQTLREIMTSAPTMLPRDSTVVEAARLMRDEQIGDVLVMDDGAMCGIVTDRDIVIRAIATGQDPRAIALGDICSEGVETLTPDSGVDEAIRLMRSNALRRVPVVDGDKPVGIVSLGDLAVEHDRGSVLGDISAAPPND